MFSQSSLNNISLTTPNDDKTSFQTYPTSSRSNVEYQTTTPNDLSYLLHPRPQTDPLPIRPYVFCDEYMRMVCLHRLATYFQEADGFIAQLDKYKFLSWFDEVKEQLLDDFSWRLCALLSECVTQHDTTTARLMAMIAAYQTAHYKVVEAGLLLVENSASERKSLVVVNQSAGRHIKDHFSYDKVRALKNWFYAHWKQPFPDNWSKQALSRESGLDLGQVQSWFINWRDRNWKNVVPLLEERKTEMETRLAALHEASLECLAKASQQRFADMEAVIELQDSKENVALILRHIGVDVTAGVENIMKSSLYDDSRELAAMVDSVCKNIAATATTLAFLPKDRLLEMEGKEFTEVGE